MAEQQAVQYAPASAMARPLADVLAISPAITRLSREPVDDAVLRDCLDAAAASGPARYELVIVRDPDVLHQLARIYRQAWGVYKRLLPRGTPIEERQWQADHFEEVPVAVVGCAKGLRPLFPAVGAARFYGAVLPPLQNFLLAARAHGLAASFSALPVWSLWQTRRTLHLPLTVTPVALATVGHPLRPVEPAPARNGVARAALDRHGHPFPSG